MQARGASSKLAAYPETNVDSQLKDSNLNGAKALADTLAPSDHYQPSFCLDITIPKHLKDAVMASEQRFHLAATKLQHQRRERRPFHKKAIINTAPFSSTRQGQRLSRAPPYGAGQPSPRQGHGSSSKTKPKASKPPLTTIKDDSSEYSAF